MQPFLSKNNVGLSTFDKSKQQTTTIDYEAAFLLVNVIDRILEGKEQIEGSIDVPCGTDARLEFSRNVNNGRPETWLNLTKNGITIGFLFDTRVINIKVDGQFKQEIVETGLGSFKKTLNGYLEGINAERHLNKLTDDYIKANGGNNDNNDNGNNNRKPYYNNNNGYRKQYNNNYNRNNYQQPKQQDMSSYQINN
jgi:hypothetical protein